MRKRMHLFLLILIPLVGMSQKKISFGLNFNTLFSKMKITNSNSFSPTIIETGRFGFGYGIGAYGQYSFTNKLFTRLGIAYQDQTYASRDQGSIFGCNISLTGASISYLRNRFNITAINIPIEVLYKLESDLNNIQFYLGLGGQLNIFQTKSKEAKYDHKNCPDEIIVNKVFDVNPSPYSLSLISGIEHKFAKHYFWIIEPSIRFTPNTFILAPFESQGKTFYEVGISFRVRK